MTKDEFRNFVSKLNVGNKVFFYSTVDNIVRVFTVDYIYKNGDETKYDEKIILFLKRDSGDVLCFNLDSTPNKHYFSNKKILKKFLEEKIYKKKKYIKDEIESSKKYIRKIEENISFIDRF